MMTSRLVAHVALKCTALLIGRNIICWLILALLFSSPSHPATGQIDRPQALSLVRKEVIVVFDMRKRMIVRRSEVGGVPQLSGSLCSELIRYKNVKSHLALSNDQAVELEHALQAIDTEKKRLLNRVSMALDQRTGKLEKHDLISIDDWFIKTEKCLERILFRNQNKELEEFANLVRIRTGKWKPVVLEAAAACNESVNNQHLKRISDSLVELKNTSRTKVDELVAAISSELDAVYNVKQQQQLEEYHLFASSAPRKTPQSLLVWQLESMVGLEEDKLKVHKNISGELLLETLALVPHFSLNQLGELEDRNKKTEMAMPKSMAAFYTYESVLTDSQLRSALTLSHEQISMINEISESTKRRISELAPTLTTEKVSDLREEYFKLGVNRFVDTLLPHQRNSLDRVGVSLDYIKRGPLAALSNPLVETLGISEKQRSQFRQIAKDGLKRIDKLSKELENTLKTTIVANISSQAVAKKFDSMVGDPTLELACNLDLFMFFLD